MQPSLEKLQKIFKLEADMGFTNRAIIGGFEKMATTWESEARSDSIPEDLIQAISERLRSYGNLAPASRLEAMQGLWKRIQRTLGDELVSPFEKVTHSRSVQARQKSPRESQLAEPAGDTISPGESDVPLNQEAASHQPPVAQTPRPPVRDVPAALNAKVTTLQGVGPQNAHKLEKLGIFTLGDLLYHFPRRYVDYSNLKTINRLWYGEEVTVIGSVETVNQRSMRNGGLKITEALLTDGSGAIRLTFFNQPWLAKQFESTPHISVSGKVKQHLGRLVMENPEWEPLDEQQLHTNRIVPVYPTTANLKPKMLRTLINSAVGFYSPRVPDPLPEELRLEAGLMDLPTALAQIHFPDSWEEMQSARHRLAFDEIFMLQLGVLEQKLNWQNREGRVFEVDDNWLESLIGRLPYTPTNAQQRAINDLRHDLHAGVPMNRLLQGDVGSGKTLVAALGVTMTTASGAQAAIMAPTSILAEQHYRNLTGLLSGHLDVLPIGAIRLLVGSTPEAEKRDIRSGLESGEVKLVIGTHALIEDPVNFQDLQLAVIDEQHRFGVEQRASLRSKGSNPHLLVMTATPIPRSLALTVYGDLDLTVLDEMPPGRQHIDTFVLHPTERERAFTLVRRQINEGRQAFVIYPLVEESEKSEAMAAVEEHERLSKSVFPEFSLGLLHGRLRPEDKDAVMAEFRDRKIQILVSTSVVEVGVDVPNATVMIVEGAERFGLAQLHQFRGRVGRGEYKSYCLLIPATSDAVENERLSAMANTNDGFILAEKDLEQRGPGDFLGSRQSGFADLRMALLTDVRLIDQARQFALKLFQADPRLELPDHALIRSEKERFWRQITGGDIS